jgi:hypothetical protein
MGPHQLGAENKGGHLIILDDYWLQWSHTNYGAEMQGGLVPPRRRAIASMEPHRLECGNIKVESGANTYIALQWGRTDYGAETPPVLEQGQGQGLASMEPRWLKRGTTGPQKH